MFTGRLTYRGERISRKHLQEAIERNGGTWTQKENSRGLSPGTHYLVLGDWNNQIKDPNNSKLSDAKKKGIPVISGDELLDMFDPIERSQLLLQKNSKRAA